MQLYGIKSCDTCRKALSALPQAEFVDVRNEGVPPDVLHTALQVFGAALVNTRSTTWRGLSERERERSHLDLLNAYPTLMKRPLIVDGGKMYLGWAKVTQSALGG